ncbi:lysine biosynthesis protein LysW [Streptomyces sp. NPDC102451]|uniref:lysine biosynthesis protein LysW n=1 Tax=Streptomyces sp. NPDC102451 TaxID=3366177 RepID=UPI0037F62FA9
MPATISVPQCLVCDTDFEIQDDWERGEITACGACGQEHEVVEKSDATVRVALAPEVEEDWGE